MTRLFAALFAVGIVFGATPFGGISTAEAASFELTFSGKLVDGTSRNISGAITSEDAGATLLGPVDGITVNRYSEFKASYEVLFDSLSYARSLGAAGAQFVKGGASNPYGAPFVSAQVQFSPAAGALTSLNWFLSSTGTNPLNPVLSFDTMPTNYAAWVAAIGATTAARSNFSVGTNSYDFVVTGYSLAAVTTPPPVATTPIPGALLMFGTALAGLGVLAYRRRRLET